jgi:hypothetical protein
MNSRVDEILRLIAECGEHEQRSIFKSFRSHPLEREWNIDAYTILDAISRSSDLTIRGIRGIVAEAAFQDLILTTWSENWAIKEIDRHEPYDFHLVRRADQFEARVQVKLQRKEKQQPKAVGTAQRKLLLSPPKELYVVEVQRTRTGRRALKLKTKGQSMAEKVDVVLEDTRPYRFGEFDILAVNLHPVTGNWRSFMYTVANWLIPRASEKLIDIMQPVACHSDNYWTDDLNECIQWFSSGRKGRLYEAKLKAAQERN